MAAGTLAQPGDEYGPCLEKCDHTDCDFTRRMIATKCSHCDEPIGDRRFFNATPHDKPVYTVLNHESCTMDAIDAERGGMT